MYRETEAFRRLSAEKRREIERGIGFQGIERVAVKRLKDLHAEFPQRIASSQERALHFGFPLLDSAMRGVIPSHICTLAARPGVGKSNLVLNLLRNQCSLAAGKRVLLFSLEMSYWELFERCCQISSRFSSSQVVNLARDQGEDYREMIRKVEKDFSGMWVVDETGLTPRNIMHVAELYDAHFGQPFDALIIDYFNLLRGEDRFVVRSYERATAIARELQGMAKELDRPVILVAQLRRGKAPTERPEMDDLRDTGALEESSGVVLGLWRPDNETLAMGILKNKRGRTGTFEYNFNVENLSIENERIKGG